MFLIILSKKISEKLGFLNLKTSFFGKNNRFSDPRFDFGRFHPYMGRGKILGWFLPIPTRYTFCC